MKSSDDFFTDTTRRGFIVLASGVLSAAALPLTNTPNASSVGPPRGVPILEGSLTRPSTASYLGTDGTLSYVGENDGGSSVYQSKDLGQTWSAVATFANQSFESRCFTANALGHLFFSPWGPSVDTAHRGLWRSIDKGKTWTRVLDLSAFPSPSGIWGITSLSNGVMYAGVYNSVSVSMANNASIFRSKDNGATWTSVYKNTAVFNIHDVAADPKTGYVYATLGYSGTANKTAVVRSTDGGVTWAPILSGLPQIVPICVTPTSRLFASADSTVTGIYRTTDDRTFTRVLTDEPLFAFWLRLDSSNGWIYAGFTTNPQNSNPTLGKIYVSKNDGQTWALHSQWPSVGAFDGTQFASNIYGGKMAINLIGAYQEMNGALVYTQDPVGYLSVPITASHFGADGKLTFVGANGPDTVIYQSGDNGITWTGVSTFANQRFESRCLGSNSLNDLFMSPWGQIAQSFQGLYISRDNGRSWNRVLDLSGAGFPNPTGIWGLASFSDGSMYAGVYSEDPSAHECYIYKSSDYGTTWAVSYHNAAARHIHDVQVHPHLGYVYASYGDSFSPFNSKGLVRSEDSGKTWTPILTSLPQMVAICVTATCRIFGTDDPAVTGIYRTTDDTTATLVLSDTELFCFWLRQDPKTLAIYAGFNTNPNSDPSTAPAVPAAGKIYVSADDGVTWSLHSLWPAVYAFDGPNFASNIFNSKMAINLQYNKAELNGALITTS